MKQIKFTAFLLALACISCQKEASLDNQEAVGSDDVVRVFKAETESYATKTYSDPAGYILWNAGDRVSVFEGSGSNGQYEVSNESAGSTSAELVRVAGGGFVAGTELGANIAYYPYSSSNSVRQNGDKFEISVTLPQTQQYVAGSFGNGSFPMVAVTADSDDKNLRFKNVLGCLKIQLKGDAVIKSITVTNKTYPMSGPVKVSASNTVLPTVAPQSGSVKTVTLDCGAGVQLNNETATSFMIALPPARLTSGFSIEIADISGNHMTKTTSKLQVIERSKILVMPELVVMQPNIQSVDLGLPSGTKWATHNMGAFRPEDRGNFYAWGETKTMGEVDMSNTINYNYNSTQYPDSPYVKHAFQAVTYKFLKAGATNSNANSNITKYTWADGSFTSLWYMGDTFVGDGKTELDPEDDAAAVNWGNGWRMPTRAEIQELLDNCDITKTVRGDVLACEFTSRINGNSIIIPAGGYMSNTAVSGGYGSGYGIWSSSLFIKNGESFAAYSYQAAFLNLNSSVNRVHLYQRYVGLPIRPVRNN